MDRCVNPAYARKRVDNTRCDQNRRGAEHTLRRLQRKPIAILTYGHDLVAPERRAEFSRVTSEPHQQIGAADAVRTAGAVVAGGDVARPARGGIDAQYAASESSQIDARGETGRSSTHDHAIVFYLVQR